MITPLRSVSLLALTFSAISAPLSFAQAPVTAPAPRVDTVAPLPAPMTGLLTVAEQGALDALSKSAESQRATVTAARAALTAASVASPKNDADLRGKADAVAKAEQALASALAEKFAALQAGPNPISAAKIPAAIARLYVTPAMPGGGGRGGPGGFGGAEQAALNTGVIQQTMVQRNAATTARQELQTASFAMPRNDATIQAKATALASAEQALASAVADKFAALQAGPTAIAVDKLPGVTARLSMAGGRGGLGAPRSADDTRGFVSIFDGKTLTGWDGDPKFWRAENGTIIGESTPEKVVTQNTFLIWRGGITKDFELKTEFRMNGTNSGIQYRSREVPEAGKWVLSGYQADIDFANVYAGQISEERGRNNIMVPRGQMIRVTDDGAFKYLGTLAAPDEIGASVVPNGWNTYHIIVRGPVLIQILNGRVSAIMIDEDSAKRAMEGVLGLQMHVGQPFKIEYRNLMYKEL